MTTQTEIGTRTPVAVRCLAAGGVLAAIVAIGANVAVRIVAIALFDVPAEFGPLDWAPVVNTTIVGVAGATVAYGLLVRVTTRPERAFRVLALAVLLLSFVPLLAPPSFLAGAPWTVLATLGAMHLTTAAAALAIIPRAAASDATDAGASAP